MLLEKFGIVSNERKREITELKKISDIAKEDNRLNDYENFYNKHQSFKLESDLSTDFPLEIVLNREKKNKEIHGYVKDNRYRISDNFYYAQEYFKIIDFGDNVTKIEDVSELKKFSKGIIEDIYKDSKYIRSMNYYELKDALNFLKKSHLKKILYNETDTLEFLETVIENQIKKLEPEIKKIEKSSNEYVKPLKIQDWRNAELINEDMPKSVSNYEVQVNESPYAKTVSYYNNDLIFKQKYDGFASSLSLKEARIEFRDDAFYETTKKPKERELVENITMANLINLKQELNKEETYLNELSEYVTSNIRPKLAFKLLEIFPDAEITLVNKTAKGRNAAKLLEIASKSGEEVLMKFKSEDLKNNKKLDSKKEDVIKYIKSMEK